MKALLLLVGMAAFAQQQLTLTDPQGRSAGFTTGAGEVTVVVFLSTVCPVSNSYNARMIDLYRDYAGSRVKFLFVNSNRNETLSVVQEHARQAGYPFPVYRDIGNALANRLAANYTPEAFVIDGAGKIQYRGGIDDAQNPARVTRSSLRLALDAVLSGAAVAVPETKSFGCAIKRGRRTS